MKAIHAYVREHMTERVIRALADAGCHDLSVLAVRGVKQGLAAEDYSFSVELGQQYERLLKLEIVAADEVAATWMEVIAAAARTGEHGDGMVFIVPVEDALRISTGERGAQALSHRPRRSP